MLSTEKPTLFNGRNWSEYRLKTRALALSKDWTGIMDGKENAPTDPADLASYNSRKTQCYAYLINTQSSSTLATLGDIAEGDVAEVWTRLKQQYESGTRASLKHLLLSFLEIKQGSKSSAEFVSEAMTMKLRIDDITTTHKANITEELLMTVLISGLPRSKEVLKQQLLMDSSLTIDRCRQLIIQADEYSSLGTLSSAFRACTHCNKEGHEEKTCFILHPELRRGRKKRSGRGGGSAPAANKATGSGNGNPPPPHRSGSWAEVVRSGHVVARAAHALVPRPGSKTFTVDSGATDHFVSDPTGLSGFNPLRTMEVCMADGSRETTVGAGDIAGKLKDVHVVPSFEDDLLSVPRLYEDGKAVLFSPRIGGVLIADEKDLSFSCPSPLIVGPYENKSFKVTLSLKQKGAARPVSALTSAVALPQASERRRAALQIWFRRLGYPNPDRLIHAVKKGLVKGVSLPPDVKKEEFEAESNDAYQFGRSRAAPHYDLGGEKRSTSPYELVHFDIKTMDQECWGRFKYWVVLVDDYTRHSKVILLRHKDDLLEEIRRWHQQELVSAGYKVGVFQCDNAGEQKSGLFDDFLTVIGTRVQYTNPHSSASNGIAERQIQKIGNTAHCIRVGARLPKAAWGECHLTAARVENILPHRANPDSKSPYQMLTGKVPDVSYLRAIGAKCYVHVPGDTRKALDDKAQVGTMIGYATKTNGYRVLLNNSTGKIVESASVTFAEAAKDMSEKLYSSGGTDPDADFCLPGEYFSPLVVGETRDTTYDKKIHPTIHPTMLPTIGNNVPTIAPTQPGVPMPAPLAALQTVPDDAAPAHDAGDAQVLGEGVPDDLAAILDPVVVFGFDPDAIPDVRRNAPRNRHPPERYTPAAKMIRVVKMSEQAKKATLVRAATSQALGTKITNKEALEDPRIRDAMLKEIKHLFNIGAFTVTELPQGHSEITATWAHKLKYDANGQFIKAKSRIAPRGFQQIAGESYDPEKVEAPTLRMETMSLCLALTVQRDMHVVMLDVDAAFTIPVNPYPTYMKPPLGIKLEKGQTLKIERALNGTMQSAYCWNEEIDGFLKSLGLSPTILDPCLYVRWKGEQLSMVALYVDDLRVMCDVKDEAEDIQRQLKEKYPIKITDTNQWLGMRVLHDRMEGTIRISQPAYIDSLLREYGMDAANPTQTPAEPNTKLLKSSSPPGSVNFPYRELVGNLLWLARTSRPDILYAVGQLCSHVINFDNFHVTAAKKSPSLLERNERIRIGDEKTTSVHSRSLC